MYGSVLMLSPRRADRQTDSAMSKRSQYSLCFKGNPAEGISVRIGAHYLLTRWGSYRTEAGTDG